MPLTRNEALLDINVLIAALLPNHSQHALALRTVKSLRRFYTTPTTQGGFLRFATRPLRPAVGGEPVAWLTMARAHAALRELASGPTHGFLPDDLPFTAIEAGALTGHRQWTDAYLLRLAQRHRLAFASFDRGILAIDDPQEPTLWLIQAPLPG